MNKDVVPTTEKSKVDLINEKIISLTFRAELQRKAPEEYSHCDDVLSTLTREMLNV